MSVTPAHRQNWSGLATGGAQAQVGVLGIPFDQAVSFRKGAAQAPARLRALTHYMPPITEEGHLLDGLTVCDYGDVERDLNWERYFASVAERAFTALAHPFTLFIGGDHSVTIPLMQAFSQKFHEPFGVIHIDAHTDLLDSYEGHPWSHACTARRALELPNLAARHYVFCGIRSWEKQELQFLADTPDVSVYTARRMHQDGLHAIAENVILRLGGLERVYLTLDIDSLDPACAPGTGTPEAGGLSSRDLIELLRMLFAALPIRAMDVVEIAPPLDTSDVTSLAALKVIYEVFGWLHMHKGGAAP